MRVRFYDKETGKYHKSEVYAVINAGNYEKQLLFVKSQDGGYFKFYDRVNKTDRRYPLINMIISKKPEEWIYKRAKGEKEQLGGYKSLLKDDILFFEYTGFSWLWNDTETLLRLLNGEKVFLCGSIFAGKLYSDMGGSEWSFIESQEDADAFEEGVYDLHDAVIKEIRYVSGAYVAADKRMYPFADQRSVVIHIQSQQCPDIELVFEGVTALNLRPPKDNYGADIFESSLIVQDASIFFCDGLADKINTSYAGTWITAYSLRWRFIKQNV